MNAILAFSIVAIIELLLFKSFYKYLKTSYPRSYLSLSEIKRFLIKGNVIRYIFYRFLPFSLIFLINYNIFQYIQRDISDSHIIIINLAIIAIHLATTNLRIINNSDFNKKLKATNYLTIVILLLSPFFCNFIFPYLKAYLPTAQGLIDNLWSVIISVYLFSFIVYLKFDTDSYDEPSKNQLINSIKNYSDTIGKLCSEYNADENLVKAIAIYENLQRPKYIRFFERLLARIVKKQISQGLMQIKHRGPLSDNDSIVVAVKMYFVGSKNIIDDYFAQTDLIRKYNNSDIYLSDVLEIYSTIKA